MNWITLLGLIIMLGKSALALIDPKLGPVFQALYDEVAAAINALAVVHAKAVTLSELEDLRTKPLW